MVLIADYCNMDISIELTNYSVVHSYSLIHICKKLLKFFPVIVVVFLPACESEQGNVIGLVSVYIYIYIYNKKNCNLANFM